MPPPLKLSVCLEGETGRSAYFKRLLLAGQVAVEQKTCIEFTLRTTIE